MKRNCRGAAPVVYLVGILLLGAAALVPHFGIPALLQPKPPTAQLDKADAELRQAQAELATTQKALNDAKTKEDKATHDQTQYSQGMVSGAKQALAQVPPEHQTPEVKLAANLIDRADHGLVLAIGRLPEDQQAEMTLLVNEALSQKQAQIDAAYTALALKDKSLQDTTTAKLALEKQIPVLAAQVETKSAQVSAADARKEDAIAVAKQWIIKKAQADEEAGSFKGYFIDVCCVLFIFIIGYVLVHICFPSLAQEFPNNNLLVGLNKVTKSITSAHL